jgi:hypothetical protein
MSDALDQLLSAMNKQVSLGKPIIVKSGGKPEINQTLVGFSTAALPAAAATVAAAAGTPVPMNPGVARVAAAQAQLRAAAEAPLVLPLDDSEVERIHALADEERYRVIDALNAQKTAYYFGKYRENAANYERRAEAAEDAKAKMQRRIVLAKIVAEGPYTSGRPPSQPPTPEEAAQEAAWAVKQGARRAAAAVELEALLAAAAPAAEAEGAAAEAAALQAELKALVEEQARARLAAAAVPQPAVTPQRAVAATPVQSAATALQPVAVAPQRAVAATPVQSAATALQSAPASVQPVVAPAPAPAAAPRRGYLNWLWGRSPSTTAQQQAAAAAAPPTAQQAALPADELLKQIEENREKDNLKIRLDRAALEAARTDLTPAEKKQAFDEATRLVQEYKALMETVEVNREERARLREQAAAAPKPPRRWGFWGGRKTGRKRRSLHSRPSRKRRG